MSWFHLIHIFIHYCHVVILLNNSLVRSCWGLYLGDSLIGQARGPMNKCTLLNDLMSCFRNKTRHFRWQHNFLPRSTYSRNENTPHPMPTTLNKPLPLPPSFVYTTMAKKNPTTNIYYIYGSFNPSSPHTPKNKH